MSKTSTATMTATLTFLLTEILYDIRNDAWITGDALITEDAHDRHLIQDIAEDGNKDHISRVLDMAEAEVNDFLYPFTKTEPEDGIELTDRYELKDKYTITLSLPSTFPGTSTERLRRLIHQYFVYRVIEDWLRITGKADLADIWLTRLTGVIDDIKSTAARRTERVRLSLHPF